MLIPLLTCPCLFPGIEDDVTRLFVWHGGRAQKSLSDAFAPYLLRILFVPSSLLGTFIRRRYGANTSEKGLR